MRTSYLLKLFRCLMFDFTITHKNVDCYQRRGVICTQSVFHRYNVKVWKLPYAMDFITCCFVCEFDTFRAYNENIENMNALLFRYFILFFRLKIS